ncbi:RebA2 protein [Azorhizobium caulinodans ORS 571]|uniref:RebA2 protein n=2 Tax=Xanthobacteraceae TaxID=335928 RepID=A8INT2_AZOC5|nr:RebA2 protein [Azorhizobium caulinodans ORS 571]
MSKDLTEETRRQDMTNTVSPQITDAVTQVNVKVVAEAPAVAIGSLYQTASHSTGLMFENAVTAQNNQNILAQAATTQGVMQIYSIDTISDAIAVVQMLQGNANT